MTLEWGFLDKKYIFSWYLGKETSEYMLTGRGRHFGLGPLVCSAGVTIHPPLWPGCAVEKGRRIQAERLAGSSGEMSRMHLFVFRFHSLGGAVVARILVSGFWLVDIAGRRLSTNQNAAYISDPTAGKKISITNNLYILNSRSFIICLVELILFQEASIASLTSFLSS